MKKKLLIILIVLGVIHAILWSFNILRFYENKTVANEPNLKVGAKILWSSLATPERLDFICFRVKDENIGNYDAVMRLVALPNDVLEIIDGDLYVNNKLIDKELELRIIYKCDNSFFLEKIKPLIGHEVDPYFQISEDSMAVCLDETYLTSSKLELERLIQSKSEVDELIRQTYNRNWNMDHFGPLKIPENKYFVMGDNRGNSMDSRYIGSVSKKDILGTVIYNTNQQR